MTQANQSGPALVERIVTSPKGFYATDPENPRLRKHAPKGSKVRVTPRQASAFKHALVDPAVLRAQAEAVRAEAAAAEEAENAEQGKAAASGSGGSGAPAPSGSGGGASQGSGGSAAGQGGAK